MVCIVCSCETRKYKCPNCLEYYCSLTCFKTHRENKCNGSSNIKEQTIASPDAPAPILTPFRTEDTVDPNKMEELKNSEDLRLLLRNPHLRNFLKEVDQAPNAWNAMKLAMQEPLFIEFSDVCLKIVDPAPNDIDDPFLNSSNATQKL